MLGGGIVPGSLVLIGGDPGIGKSTLLLQVSALLAEAGARVLYSILHPGVVVEPGAVVEYAILGEGTVVGAGAHVGAQPDGTDAWCVATVGPDVAVPAGATVPAGAMIYDGAEVHA